MLRYWDKILDRWVHEEEPPDKELESLLFLESTSEGKGTDASTEEIFRDSYAIHRA